MTIMIKARRFLALKTADVKTAIEAVMKMESGIIKTRSYNDVIVIGITSDKTVGLFVDSDVFYTHQINPFSWNYGDEYHERVKVWLLHVEKYMQYSRIKPILLYSDDVKYQDDEFVSKLGIITNEYPVTYTKQIREIFEVASFCF